MILSGLVVVRDFTEASNTISVALTTYRTRAEVNKFVCRQFPVEMASEELESFLNSVSLAYLAFADAIHEGGITSNAELGAVERTDLQTLGIPLGAAALIIATARGSGDSFGTLLFSYINMSQLTTEAKPASLAGQEADAVSFWAKAYRGKLQALPAPYKFGTMWSAFQTPQGNLGDEVEFDKHGPLLNIYRPQSAKVWPNRRCPLYDSFHADFPCAELPAVIVVARNLLIQRLQQLLSETNLMHVLLGMIFVALCHMHVVAWQLLH